VGAGAGASTSGGASGATVNSKLTGLDTLPARSVAREARTWSPRASTVTSRFKLISSELGVQAPPSSWYSIWATPLRLSRLLVRSVTGLLTCGFSAALGNTRAAVRPTDLVGKVPANPTSTQGGVRSTVSLNLLTLLAGLSGQGWTTTSYAPSSRSERLNGSRRLSGAACLPAALGPGVTRAVLFFPMETSTTETPTSAPDPLSVSETASL
jgi:hypothetical protein